MITVSRFFRPCVAVEVIGARVENVPPARGPRIAFSVSRTLTSTADTAEIQIFGLAPTTRVKFSSAFAELGYSTVTLRAGYEGVLGSLFEGDLRKLNAATFAHADVPVTFHADDAGDAIADATLPSTLPSTLGFNARNMIDAAILAFAQPVVGLDGQIKSPGVALREDTSVAQVIATAAPAAVTTTYTFVNVGTARDLLDEAARLLGCRWWINNRTLYMQRRGRPIDGLARQLPRSHWLSEPAETGDGLVTVDTFLDPSLLPGRQVSLVGRNAPPPSVATKLGLPPVGAEPFRIEAATYTGDTHSDTPWRASLTMARIEVL